MPRYKDSNNKVKTIDVPWAEPYERMTWLLEKKTLDTLQCTKSQSKTARLLGLSFDQVHRVMHNFVERGMSKRSADDRYYYLSIDKKSVSRGHDYFSILSEESTGVVIDVVEGRTKESVDKLCNKLTKDQRDEVKTICTDMWDAFIYGAKNTLRKSDSLP